MGILDRLFGGRAHSEERPPCDPNEDSSFFYDDMPEYSIVEVQLDRLNPCISCGGKNLRLYKSDTPEYGVFFGVACQCGEVGPQQPAQEDGEPEADAILGWNEHNPMT